MGQYRPPEIEFGPLADLPRAELATRWQTYYRVDPPKGISRQLLVRAIAYQMQAKRYGALKPASLRRLHKVLQGHVIGNKAGIARTAKLHPGARLVREWNGISHVVEVPSAPRIEPRPSTSLQGSSRPGKRVPRKEVARCRFRFFGFFSEGGTRAENWGSLDRRS